MAVTNHHPMTKKKLISKAMSIIGSIKTKRKREHAASIAHLGGKARWKNHTPKQKRNTGTT